MPPYIPKIVAGYVLNSLETDIISISITHPKNGMANFWAYELELILLGNLFEFQPTTPIYNEPKVHIKDDRLGDRKNEQND